ncbi:tyrosine-type recombinase/integrase [Virgibacillus pantothenticus]|uniref:site-specific tyrosine recombinase/integron integrase n=1 Tax=Virgibacillus pantothenticus TaxID=1473 RepID=UPI001C21BB29|nr:site-specific tyrosine recombinase/integron integrase [Virgibacillus pantothenticus]MBU8567950.1 tyrosine-type recombinase/integrase [Virgibacillus pantothenticus]MBU8601793.1 tyrosine-type recombinase/integrase [Virgibacillus pantothenticus]MBU8635947.1 tyrosine-type recombinase/integrase [Virgibacillus pantothenticus]MBU8643631.1 tyrosine-type recombinase/integrase [Virgibacillus pantothenticus]MBU8647771.1 tyrosine-type recombinase/integrase [Virgibacillus pantothenticus]
MLLSEAWDKYHSDKRIEGYSSLTLKMYGFQCNLLKRYFGDIRIGDITTDNLKQYLVEAGEHLKPSSLGHRIRFIRSLFKWTHEEGYILKNPATKLKEPKLGKRIPKFLTKHEIEHLREGCHTPMENALFEFFYSTGCRIGEVAKINKDDINFTGNSVIVHGKGDKEREVYFNIRCAIWLKRYLEEREDNQPCLFVTERKPIRRMSIDTLRHIVKRISNRAGIKKTIHPHQLRHSFATHMIVNGAPLEVIQSLLGHEKSETTRIYAHLSGKLRHDFYSKYF